MNYLKDRISLVLEMFYTLRKEKVHRLVLALLIVVTLLGSIAYYFERNNPESSIRSISDGIWWGFVTITTVGYGDKYPITWQGKIAGIIIMTSGLILTVIVSGTIASILVERKMKEGKGLQKIGFSNHIIICGWNQNATKMLNELQALTNRLKEEMHVVLINELDIDSLNEYQFAYSSKLLSIDFIRGNFTQEQVLEKGGVRKAKSVIILADESGGNTLQHSDERTVLACYTISNLSISARVGVELINHQNEQYLKRTNVDSIIVNGEFNSFLLINSALFPGVPEAVKEIMNFDFINDVTTRNIPSSFHGKSFSDLFNYFRDRDASILIGIVTDVKKLSIDDFLTEDPSSIDDFIKRKFAESEKDYFTDTGEKKKVTINPGWTYVIKENDRAIVIGEVKGHK